MLRLPPNVHAQLGITTDKLFTPDKGSLLELSYRLAVAGISKCCVLLAVSSGADWRESSLK